MRQFFRDSDSYCLAACFMLLSIGLTSLFSLSLTSTTDFFLKQSFFAVFGVILFFLLKDISLNEWRQWSRRGFAIATGLMLIVLIFGSERNGAKRWLDLGFFSLQPTEFLKFFVLLFVARWCANLSAKRALGLFDFLPMLLCLSLALCMVIVQPDFGSFCLLLAVIVTLFFLAGLQKRWILTLLSSAIGLMTLMIFTESYRYQRIIGFLDPFADPYGAGYNQVHSLMAYARGGWWGTGLGRSIEKMNHLPEAHNDFIIAIIAEEMGLVGFILVCLLFLFLVTRIIGIARQASERGELFGALYAFGLALLLSLQVLVNIGGSLALLPPKGLTLPLISYGGSSLVITFVMLAVLLRVDRENNNAAKERSSRGR